MRKLPQLFRRVAIRADILSPETAIWMDGGLDAWAADQLWRSFVGDGAVTRGDEAVLGLLLLAEVLETAD